MSIAEKLAQIADNEPKVFNAGKQAEHDAFWDSYQQKGARVNYSCAFGAPWTAETFRPKYSMQPITALMMFRECGARIDLVERLDALGVTLDFSRATNLQYLFQNSVFTRIGVIDMSGCNTSTPGYSLFAYCSILVTIDKIILKTGTAGEFSSDAFINCSALENLTLEGNITRDVNLQWSKKLTHASIESILLAAYNRSDLSKVPTVTLSKAAVDKAYETSEGANDGSTGNLWVYGWEANANFNITLI